MDEQTFNFTIREAVAEDAESYNHFMRQIADEPNNGVTFHAGEFTDTIEDTQKRLTTMHEKENCVIFVAVDESNQVIGECSGFASDRIARHHCVGLGITVSADHRRQGIGTALMQAIIAWAEANPTVYRLDLEVYTSNIRALNMYLKLGFVLEGTRRKAYRKHGQFKDAYMMAILFDRESE